MLAFRDIDRLGDEIDDLVAQAESYLKESGLRRIRRSPLTRMLKAVPLLTGPVGAAQDLAESLETSAHVAANPLAYFAFAQVELKLDERYHAQPESVALLEFFS